MKNIVLCMGGISSEREVSLMSGSGVRKALESKGLAVTVYDPAVDSVELLEAGKFDAAFIALHGKLGEDGSMQGLFNVLGIPYTGPGVRACAAAMDKDLTKTIWRAAGIPVPRGLRVEASAADDAALLARLIDEFGASGLVIKPDQDGSSIGVTKLPRESLTAEALAAAIAQACRGGKDAALVEEYIHGREFTIAVIDGKALPVIEIKAPEGSYDFQNKYYTDTTQYVCPAALTAEQTAELQRLTQAAFAALGCRGWSRVDALMREDGTFALLEINTSPGMTPHSLVPMAARTVGMDYADLCLHVLSLADVD